jgi:ribosome-associated protein
LIWITMETRKKAKLLYEAGLDMKGLDALCLDVRGISSITDYMIIISGTSDRHVKAIADNVMDELKKMGEATKRAEGMEDGNWVLVDAFDVMVHVFKESVREFYNLEELWDRAKKVSFKG